jgi:hypothetical protein
VEGLAETSEHTVERSVWWAIARLATSRGLLSRREVTLMLKGSLIAKVAAFFAAMLGRSDGNNWA